MNSVKIRKIAALIIGGIILALGLLWFFQQQGLVKIFPTADDRAMSAALRIDESKFKAAVGVSDEEFQKQVEEVYSRRDKVKERLNDSSAWFSYGYQLNYLNDYAGAVRAWEVVFKLQPQNYVASANLASNYQYFLRNYERAEFFYEQTLILQPSYTDAWLGLGELYRFNWNGKTNLVEPLMLEAVRNDSANGSAYLSFLVGFFAEGGEFAKAKDYYVRVRALKPSAADDLLETYPGLQ